MSKFCVFCGKKPESKTREHVIPQWLIKYTGDPNRVVSFGFNWRTGSNFRFSFNQFQFPACDNCNSSFARLEDDVKPIIINMLDEKSLSSKSFSILLSWIDKVRIGLWLGFMQLGGNPFGLKPNFHIARRMSTTDRMLLIYKAASFHEHLWAMGHDTPAFAMAPVCFTLGINQFVLVNLSMPFLFSRRLGLPFPSEAFVTENGGYSLTMERGLKRVLFPLIRKPYYGNCTEIFQPIVDLEFMALNNYKPIYNTEYVRQYIDIEKSNIGEMLIVKDNRIILYSTIDELAWNPSANFDLPYLAAIITEQVLQLQLWLLDEMPSRERLSAGSKRIYKQSYSFAKMVNRTEISKLEKKLRSIPSIK